MHLSLSSSEHTLIFKRPMLTSRGELRQRNVFLLELHAGAAGAVPERHADLSELSPLTLYHQRFIGEAAPLPGLSVELTTGGGIAALLAQLHWLCTQRHHDPLEYLAQLETFPALAFAYETAWERYLAAQTGEQSHSRSRSRLAVSAFTMGKQGLRINGLVWMGPIAALLKAAEQLWARGFRCIKLKVGTDVPAELTLLRELRRRLPEAELRLDFNGALSHYTEAARVLDALAPFNIHSVEQPMPPAKNAAARKNLRHLIKHAPMLVALDEELIGVHDNAAKAELLHQLAPVGLVLKPTLLGGLRACEQWIELAQEQACPWWITSALESNIALTAIGTWVAPLLSRWNNHLAQGFGTGQLFTNNFPATLMQRAEHLYYINPSKQRC